MTTRVGIAGGGGLEEAPPSAALFPLCFEPPFPLVREPELWVLAVGDRDTWGGATVAWSEDGDWYPENAEGEIGPEAVVGELLNEIEVMQGTITARVRLPFRGKLRSGDAGALDRQQTLCYLGDARGTRYELFCYSEARLAGLEGHAHLYRLDGLVRRGCYGTPLLHHDPGTFFARLDANVARITLPHRLIDAHATLRLRIVSENGAEETEDPTDVDPIEYRVQGRWR